MSNKLKFGFLLCGGCAGCETAMVDLADRLVDALDILDVVFWAPTVADVKYKDLENMEDGSIDLAFVDGMVRLDEHEHMIKTLRKKSKTLVAFGACAALGGIPSMANMHTKEEIFQEVYFNTPSTDNPDEILPQVSFLEQGKFDLTLPKFLDKVKCVDDVAEVDYYVGGCPPHHDFIAKIVEKIVKNELPEKGSWITSGKSVCDFCPKNPGTISMHRQKIETIKRTTDLPDPDRCLLEQGYLCLGPMTQGDCNALCTKVNMPCRGCGGPIPGIKDFGAKAISAIGSMLKTPEMAGDLKKKYNDLKKLFYRYSFAKSMMDRTSEKK